jgi:hypothetical protein
MRGQRTLAFLAFAGLVQAVFDEIPGNDIGEYSQRNPIHEFDCQVTAIRFRLLISTGHGKIIAYPTLT